MSRITDAHAKFFAEFEKMYDHVEIAKMNKSERDVYEESLKDYRDLKSSMITYFAEGKEEGLKEGIEKGKEVGMKEGMEKQKKELIIKSFQRGLSADTIVGITDCTIDEVHEILRKEGLL